MSDILVWIIDNLMFFISCAMVCVSAIMTQKAKHDLEKRKLELEIEDIYGHAYQELISEVRRNQHDFQNQLAAIYSMHLTATSLEDLVEKQKNYGNVLLEEHRYDRILTGCNNPILAGYLYYRCVAYEKKNIRVDYHIQVDKGDCRLSLHEVIEILGILLTNAYESYQAQRKESAVIALALAENEDNLTITVENQAREMLVKEIEAIFNKGYSSKGKNRGLGLARVKQLTMEVKADLIVMNQVRKNENWVCFKVVIPKWKDE